MISSFSRQDLFSTLAPTASDLRKFVDCFFDEHKTAIHPSVLRRYRSHSLSIADALDIILDAILPFLDDPEAKHRLSALEVLSHLNAVSYTHLTLPTTSRV